MLEILEVLLLPIRCLGHDGKAAYVLLFQLWVGSGLLTYIFVKGLELEGFQP